MTSRYYDKEKNRPLVVARALIPIHMMLNRYGHAALNDWDGNSIDIGNTSGDTILAPQIGAGQKNNQNHFTGILMGTVKNSNGNKQNGLFGYSDGARTIFLDAETGNANFGIAGNGQIQIDATKSTITGGDYLNDNTTGMLIDLKTPEIKFGSGNFSVSKEGWLTAKGGGSIAGWNIKDTSLSKGNTGMSSDNGKPTNKAFWAGDQFNVDFNGHVNATSIDIGGDNKNQQDVHIINGTIYSGKHKPFNSTEKGFFLNYAGLSIGEDFRVSSSGYLTAKQGTFGNSTDNFTIGVTEDGKYTSLIGKNVYLGTDKISLGSNFSVDNAGNLTATSGKLAGWNFNNKALYNDDVTNASYGQDQNNAYQKGIYFGTDGLRMGANFHVNKSGSLYSVNGTIGGWTIGSSSLTGGSLKLYSTGAINDKGDSWYITSGGVAHFSNANISDGEISGGKRTGGSISGGSISPSGVSCGSYNSMNAWCVGTLKAEKAWITDLVTDNLKAENLTYRNRDVSWEWKQVFYKAYLEKTYDWIEVGTSKVRVLTDVTLHYETKGCYLMTT